MTTDPITDDELASIRSNQQRLAQEGRLVLTAHQLGRLLAEIARLRAENTAMAEELAAMRDGAGYAVDAGVAYLQEVKRLEAKLDAAREAWETAQMAWYAGVDLLRQPDVMRGHCAAMRSALGLDQDGEGNA